MSKHYSRLWGCKDKYYTVLTLRNIQYNRKKKTLKIDPDTT